MRIGEVKERRGLRGRGAASDATAESSNRRIDAALSDRRARSLGRKKGRFPLRDPLDLLASSARDAANGPNAENEEEGADEDLSWSRSVWFNADGRLLGGKAAQSKTEVLASSASSTIFCKEMLRSEDWNSCKDLTLYDISLLARSRVVHQRCLAHDLIRRILEYSVHHSAETSTYNDAFHYLIRHGLYDALLLDVNTITRGCQYSLPLLSDILLPSLLANYFAQQRGFVGSGGDPKEKERPSGFRKDLVLRVGKECSICGVIEHKPHLSETFSLAAVKVMIAQEMQGIPSFPPSDSAKIVSFLSSKLEGAKSTSLKAHLIWFLLLVVERDTQVVSEHVGGPFLELLSRTYSQVAPVDAYLENAIQAYLLELFRACRRKAGFAASLETRFEEIMKVFLGIEGSLTKEVSAGDLIVIGNLFEMLSDNADSWSKKESSGWSDYLDSGVNCLYFLLHETDGVIEAGDKALYRISAIASGLTFFKKFVDSEEFQQSSSKRLQDMMGTGLPKLIQNVCSVYENLQHQDLQEDKLLQGVDVEQAGTKFLHGTWHKVTSSFLTLVLECVESITSDNESATRLARTILEIHRKKDYIVGKENYFEDSHAFIFQEVDQAHYSLLGLAISTFKDSLDSNGSLENAVLVWDCAAEAHFRSHKMISPVAKDILFSPKLVCAVLGRRREILQDKVGALDSFDIDAQSVAELLTESLLKAGRTSELSPDWMFGLGVCSNQIELYPVLLLYLLCLELCDSKYLLGLPPNMKVSKILLEAYCKSDTLFTEDNFVAIMPTVMNAYISEVVKEVDGHNDAGRAFASLHLSVSIIDQFTSVSYGDAFFGLNASLAFCNAQPSKEQTESWKALCAADCFDLFPSLTVYESTSIGRLFFSLPSSIGIAEACFESLLGNHSMKVAIKEGCITGFFALHCVSEFCFGEDKSKSATSRMVADQSKQNTTDLNPKRKGMIQQALVFLDKEVMLSLMKYSIDGGSPKVENQVSERKVQICKRFLEDRQLPSILLHNCNV